MIDEKKLIEEIKNIRITITGLRAEKGILSEYTKHLKDLVIQIIDDQPKVGEWIPVEEGLPEEHEIVDITYVSEIYEYKDDGDIFYIERVTGTAYYKDEKWFDEYDEYILEDVIAWKPRPEPYRKEDNK